MAQNISDVKFAILDTETTGLSPKYGGRVCELAILFIQNGKQVGSFETLIDPEGPIDPGAQRVHGITSAMVAGKPTFTSVAKQVHELLKDSTMVCHNASFDLSFMQAEFANAGLEMPEMPVLCTLKLARKHFKFPKNNLATIAETLGVQAEGWHRAGADVRILARVFDRFLADLGGRGVNTLEQLVKL